MSDLWVEGRGRPEVVRDGVEEEAARREESWEVKASEVDVEMILSVDFGFGRGMP
jgi:hypothetical protein